MKTTVIVSRFILGLGFVVFGSNIIHPFLPMPPMLPGTPVAQFSAIMGPCHWMALVGLFQLIGGALVLFGRTAPLGLALLAPVLVNILAFHVFLEGGVGIGPGLALSVLELFLIYSYRGYFSPLFTLDAAPTS